jgi:thiamine-phosphate pyrophosphorylase
MKAIDLDYNINRGIYLLSPEKILDLQQFISDIKFILKKVRLSCFQLRLKNTEDAKIIDVINLLRPILIKYKVNFIINDSVELASKYALDGLHIGEFDGNLMNIRRKFSGIIGVSCYNNLQTALDAVQMANYVSFGSFFASKTKPNAVPCSINVLTEFKKLSKTPVCVIGGINALNAKELIKNGADLVALSSAIWDIQTNEARVLELQTINAFFAV